MKASFMSELRCPSCGGKLTCIPYKVAGETEIIDGLLKCQCENAYIVYQGVPKMLPTHHPPTKFATNYREQLLQDAPALANSKIASSDTFSFSRQWAEHPYDDLTWELYLPERVNIFYRYFDLSPNQVKEGCRLLDAGCGNGTLSAQLAVEGFEVMAMDYSESVYRAYQYQLFESQVTSQAFNRLHYLQGDVLHPPFEENLFDLTYSDGVLHHTPDTKSSFMALAKLVKPGGRFFVWLYRSDTKPRVAIKLALVRLVRYLTRNLSHQNKIRLCYIGAPLLLLSVRIRHLFGDKKRRLIPVRLKALNLFDTISPQFNHTHTPAEVISWFKEAGYTDIKDVSISEYRLNEGGFAIIGTRQ